MIDYEKSDIKHLNELKSKTFINKLKRSSFIGNNSSVLDRYFNAGIGLALSHIKSSYIELVCLDGWSERKFADITFLIAKDMKSYSIKVYKGYETRYHARELNEVILVERARYIYRDSKKSGGSLSLLDLSNS